MEELGAPPEVYRNDQITLEEIKSLEKLEAIVISPGPCTPKEAGVSCDVIKYAADHKIPLLGICLGHQSIGEVFGGEIIHAPYLMHGKVSDIYHKNSDIYKDIPSPFKATRYHSLVINPDTKPDVLELTSWTEDNIIMGVAHRDLPIYGMQFHPESIITEYGHKLIDNFLKLSK